VKKNQNYRMLAVILSLTVVFAGKTGYAQTFSVLYNFGGVSGDPTFPEGPLTQGSDGALYGTSNSGGASTIHGSVFKLNTAGKVQVLYSFCAQSGCPDGSSPNAGLTLRPNGHFLGAAANGGVSNDGTLFDITESGNFTVLYSFMGGTDGKEPTTPPILGPDGNFYGTARIGGTASPCGTAYRLTPASTGTSAVFTLLHRFAQSTDGCNPSSLVLGTDGNFYGTTSFGGAAGFGTFFRLTRNGSVRALHTYTGSSDGVTPSSVTQGSDGNFYVTSHGSITAPGIILKITPTGTWTVLHTTNQAEGDLGPGLFQASDGNFYGAAESGGTSTNSKCFMGNGCGTLCQVTPAGDFTVLYDFDFTTGFEPLSGPFQHTSGLLYGNTASGGSFGGGVLYSLNNSLLAYAALIPTQAKVGTPVEVLGKGSRHPPA